MLWRRLTPCEQAQIRCGPLASVPLTALPVHRVSRMDSEPFQVVLLNRLRLLLPLSVRRFLWPLSRPFLAITEQRVRQWGSLQDLDLDPTHDSTDGRRLEVVAEDLSLFGGSQLARL